MLLEQFIFSNNFLYRLSRHLAFWLTRLFIKVLGTTLIFYDSKKALLDNIKIPFIDHLLGIIIEIPYCYFVIYFLTPFFLYKKKYSGFTVGFIIATAVNLIFSVLVLYLEQYLFNWKPNMSIVAWQALSNSVLTNSIAACGIFLMIKLFKDWHLKEKEKQALIKANAAAETELLKAQVHPHFLFNTLNNIYSFTLDRSPKAEELVSYLSGIMKYMVNDCNVELIALEKEITMVRDYIELEKVRYGNRLDIQIDIQGDYEDKAITPLLMIPFVENCFKHGASKMVKEPWIKLLIQVDENVLHFQLVNGKPAFTSKKDVMNGIGLANAKKRLELLYPNNHLLAIQETENTYSVNMQLPIDKTERTNTIRREEVYQS